MDTKNQMEQKLTPQNAFSESQDIGVVWVMDEAAKHGYFKGNKVWANFGQGEPEVGELRGGMPRIKIFKIEQDDNQYGPTNGTDELRLAIAEHYNRLYRKGKKSKYTAENVSVAMGGRLALSRIFTSLKSIRLGYKVPEYPAYHDMLNYQKSKITAVCIPTLQKNKHSIPSHELSDAITKHKLDAILFSNPCNPTGLVIKDEELNTYVRIAREQNCTLIIDEFYSHFIYENRKPAKSSISSALHIEDVNKDPILIVDGLTKSFRYPGWRLAWILGSKESIERIGKTSSGIDGGPSLPIQRAALHLFEPSGSDRESKALREVFSAKQNLMVERLQKIGMRCSTDCNSTFYVWADVSKLPTPLNTALGFFLEALKHHVICVPGNMFDIHPGKRKTKTNFTHLIRFSFGPEHENVLMGLNKIEGMIKEVRV